MIKQLIERKEHYLKVLASDRLFLKNLIFEMNTAKKSKDVRRLRIMKYLNLIRLSYKEIQQDKRIIKMLKDEIAKYE